ncbi:MAG: hypothetical protein AAGG44_15885 [Planctomycetota bacterium]
MVKKVKWILLGLVIALLVVIIFRNLEPTDLELIITEVKLPLAALLSVTLLIGFCLGILANAMWKVRKWRAEKSKTKSTD